MSDKHHFLKERRNAKKFQFGEFFLDGEIVNMVIIGKLN